MQSLFLFIEQYFYEGETDFSFSIVQRCVALYMSFHRCSYSGPIKNDTNRYYISEPILRDFYFLPPLASERVSLTKFAAMVTSSQIMAVGTTGRITDAAITAFIVIYAPVIA